MAALSLPTLVIPAAGSAVRFGSKTPKQFLTLDGDMLLIKSIQAFVNAGIQTCIVALPEAYKEEIQQQLNTVFSIDISCVSGGATRAESVYNAVMACTKAETILVHDAARPLVSEDLIKKVIHALTHHDVVIPGIPVADTLKYVENSTVTTTLNRPMIKSIQTPQGFRLNVLKNAYKSVTLSELITDESLVCEQAGIPVHVIDGEIKNIKITHPEDLESLKKT